MALFKFTKGIINKKYINLNNNGNHVRDFTYIDDIVEGVIKLINKPSNKNIPYEIFNIGNSNQKAKIISIRNRKILELKQKLNIEIYN